MITRPADDLNRLVGRPSLRDGLSVIEYQRALSTVRGLTNSLGDAEKVAAALTKLVQYVPRTERAHLPDKLAELVERDYRAEGESLRQLGQVLIGIEAALRVRRLDRAVTVLGGQASAGERLLAAHTWQVDSTRLETFSKKFKQGLKLERPEGLTELADPRLHDRVRADAEKCRASAGPLTAKVSELDLAIDFWLRGRYGEGSEVFGLAKAEAAVDDRDAARNLYLPVELPRPTDPANWDGKAPIVPHYARRHFHWWAWENHQLASAPIFDAGGLLESNLRTVWLHGTVPFRGYFGPYTHWYYMRFDYQVPDERAVQQGVNLKILARLVGYLEYEQSLTHFQRFLAATSPEEQTAADELVRGRDELAVFTNLSRFIAPANAPGAEQPTSADDRFERRGLEWIVALARLEHQAMLVGFTANPSPLVALLPPPREGEAYTELLVDAARMHYFAWQKALAKANGNLPEGADLISEARRAVLAIEFIEAAQARAGATAAAMAAWRGELRQHLERLVRRIGNDAQLLQLATVDCPRAAPGNRGPQLRDADADDGGR